MIYLNAHTDLSINGNTIPYFSEIECKNNCQSIGASCGINIPLTTRYRNKTDKTTGSEGQYLIDINKQEYNFVKGQSVKIQAWYDEYLSKYGKTTEFEGFIYDFVAGNPLKIRCLDYSFFFRFGTMTLGTKDKKFTGKFKYVLNYIIEAANKNLRQMKKEGTVGQDIQEIKLSKYFLDFDVVDLTLTNLSPSACLEWLKHELSAVCTLTGNELYFALSENTTEKVNLDTRYNVVGNPRLQKPQAAFQKFKIQAYYMHEDGTKKIMESGDEDGELHEITLHFVKKGSKDKDGKDSHQKLIDNAWNEKRLGHYTGTLETLLYPKIDLFYQVKYNDFRFPDRNGNYVVRENNLKINASGYKRTIKLAFLS